MARLKVDFKLNRAGVREMLRTLDPLVDATAEQVADAVRARYPGLPVTVARTDTDRDAATVAIAHPSGAALQLTDGALTRAAAAVGLEVHTS